MTGACLACVLVLRGWGVGYRVDRKVRTLLKHVIEPQTAALSLSTQLPGIDSLSIVYRGIGRGLSRVSTFVCRQCRLIKK